MQEQLENLTCEYLMVKKVFIGGGPKKPEKPSPKLVRTT